jgi:hypothetical protein
VNPDLAPDASIGAEVNARLLMTDARTLARQDSDERAPCIGAHQQITNLRHFAA